LDRVLPDCLFILVVLYDMTTHEDAMLSSLLSLHATCIAVYR